MKGLFHQLWLREKADHAATRADLAAHAAHFALAIAQRDAALEAARLATADGLAVAARCRRYEEQLAFLSNAVIGSWEGES